MILLAIQVKKTFYCLDVLNISRIIKSQTELKVLGLFTHSLAGSLGIPRNILKILSELHDAQLLLPIFFTLDHGHHHYYTECEHISIFPAFYSVNQRASIPQVLAQSLKRDRDNKVAPFRKLSIFLINSSDMPSVYTLAKDMAASFPFNWLNLCFKFRCEIVSLLLTFR